MTILIVAAFGVVCCFSALGIRILKITGRGVTAYLVAGIVLSLAREGFLWYLWHVSWSHSSNLLVSSALLFLCPEAILIPKLSTYLPAYGTAWDMALPSVMILIGSFLWVLPFVFLGSKKKKVSG